ncbi:hypothetical protein H6P81_019449 [Aristolochia fimbriata]|uniref:Uncharacterized protein n=1 Tax=Aristolochia fimbriata TaxID=158543 RepID=A0AAV7DTH7_ARIFI|nr:hypothetical protein H6P81_019449 [Aristolochia fimbriata]
MAPFSSVFACFGSASRVSEEEGNQSPPKIPKTKPSPAPAKDPVSDNSHFPLNSHIRLKSGAPIPLTYFPVNPNFSRL